MTKKIIRTSAMLMIPVFIALCPGCERGPKPFKDPAVVEKMKPVEDSFYEVSDWIEDMYTHYSAIRNKAAIPYGFERFDMASFDEEMEEIEDNLGTLEYALDEPYSTAIDRVFDVMDLAMAAKKEYWEMEETLASGRPPAVQVKTDAARTIGQCAKGLKAAAEAIHIPKKKWPKWIEEWLD